MSKLTCVICELLLAIGVMVLSGLGAVVAAVPLGQILSWIGLGKFVTVIQVGVLALCAAAGIGFVLQRLVQKYIVFGVRTLTIRSSQERWDDADVMSYITFTAKELHPDVALEHADSRRHRLGPGDRIVVRMPRKQLVPGQCYKLWSLELAPA